MKINISIIFFLLFSILGYGQGAPASSSCPFLESCNVKFKGYFPISYDINNSDCCNSTAEGTPWLQRQCLPYISLFYRIKHQCSWRNRLPPPAGKPVQPPPQVPSKSPPASSSCQFVGACDVKFKGFFPTFNISNPNCCNLVKETHRLQRECLPYTAVFYRIRYHCYLPRRGSPPTLPPPTVNPIQPPPQAPPASKPVQSPPQAPPIKS